MCREEDVMIDDICVIIIELEFLEPFKELRNPDRHGADEMKSLVSLRDSGRLMASSHKNDAVRGSFVPARDVAKRRIDPKRGSYVYEKENEASPENVIMEIIENE